MRRGAERVICRRCGHGHSLEQCPLCGQPIPGLLATEEQRRAYRQRLYVTVRLPSDRVESCRPWSERANYRHEEDAQLLVTYHEDNLQAFLRLWEQVGGDFRCELLFNGRRRPYDRELWVPLLWLAAEA